MRWPCVGHFKTYDLIEYSLNIRNEFDLDHASIDCVGLN